MDTTPAAYGQLTVPRFTSEEANRKGASGDQMTGTLLRLGSFSEATPKHSVGKEQARSRGSAETECLDPQERYIPLVEMGLPRGLRPSLIPPPAKAGGLLRGFR